MALALWTPERSSSREGEALDAVVEGLVGILHACQNADEETAVLTDVCVRLRGQLHAAAVTFLAPESAGAAAVLAGDGGRVDQEAARRAVQTGIAIAPRLGGDRIEAAVPVRYGGVVLAALAARWTVGTTHSLSNAATLLTMSAAAAAPAVAAAMARRRAPALAGAIELLGISPAMADVRRAIERAAAAPFCVLIEGESGCGKELVARAVHRAGPRRDRAFATLNCAALPDDLVESELFGHARGAFTGAVAERPGVFEEAHGGTLFLDEIGELSLRAQAKVLRVIQEGELRRVGENIARRVDVRILSATNRNLRDDVAAGRFRLDLLYRLDVLRIAIPPLRDRREDIAELVEQFWRDAARRIGSHATLAAATVAALARHDWPGNVRELQNVLAALAVRTPKRGVIAPAALPPQFGGRRADDTWRLDEARHTFEAQFVRAALVRAGGRRTQAASELGVTRQGLVKLMSRLGMTDASGAAGARPHAEKPPDPKTSR
jgi:transcriptional regulator with PAS, ATPase and Fis domain